MKINETVQLPETYRDSSKLLGRLSELAGARHFVFRGYSVQDQMVPKILRPPHQNLIRWEKDLLFEFERKAEQYLNTESPIDLMACAQHYGLATRLLDFTYNPFIALYFALYDVKSGPYGNRDDGEFYYLRFCDVSENILIRYLPVLNRGDILEINSTAKRCAELIDTVTHLFDPDYDFVGSEQVTPNRFFRTIAARTLIPNPDRYVKENIRKTGEGRLFFIDTSQSNQRIAAQQGLFLFPFTLDAEKHIALLEANTKLIRISRALRGELLRYLDTIGINAFRLMPDLASVCQAVEREFENRDSSMEQQ